MAAALCLVLADTLRTDWATNPQYNYGWGVLPLAIYLFFRRWKDRPAAPPTRSLGVRPVLLPALLLFLLLPIRLVQESNPDWRLINWLHALTVVGLLLSGLWAVGGGVWMRHFWLPAAFVLLAVPWPSGVERQITDGLMRNVAAITVEALNFLGILARQRGNLIELTSGVVGINEACSGVRSLQSTLMMAVFLGEYHRFALGPRLLLVGGGVSLALLFNVLRSFTVTLICARQGTAAANAWHDPAGYAVFALAFAGLLGLCAWLQRWRRVETEPPAPSTSLPVAPPAVVLGAVALWLVTVELGTDWWYRARERGVARNALWTLDWPREAAGFQWQELDEVVQRTLRYSTGSAARWMRSDQTAWLGFFFRWEPGRASVLLARNHTPDVCMPASGLQLVADHGITPIAASGLLIPFRGYTFRLGPQTLHLFYCVWEDQAQDDPGMGRGEPLTYRSRLRAVLAGRRNLGQQVLQVAVAGPASFPQARERFARELNELIRVTPPTQRAGGFSVAGHHPPPDSPSASWIRTR
jgi:exosortase